MASLGQWHPAPFTDHLIHNVVDALGRLGGVEVKHHNKARSIKNCTCKGENVDGPRRAGPFLQGQLWATAGQLAANLSRPAAASLAQMS